MVDPGPQGVSAADAVDAVGLILVLSTIVVFFLPILILFPPVPPTQTDYILQTHRRVGLDPSSSCLAKARKEAAKRQPHPPPPPSHLSSDADAAKAKDKKDKPTVRAILVHPVVSCRGIELAQAQLLPSGLQFDRLFAFAQPEEDEVGSGSGSGAGAGAGAGAGTGTGTGTGGSNRWRVLSRRELPRLAGLEVELFVPDIVKAKRQGRDELAARTTSQARAGSGFRAGGGARKGRGRGGDLSAFLILRFPWRAPGPGGLLAWLGAKLKRGWLASPEREVVLPVDWSEEGEEEKEGQGAVEEVVVLSGGGVGGGRQHRVMKALNLEAQLPLELSLYLGVSTRLGLFRVDAPVADGETGGTDQPESQAQDHIQCAFHLLSLSSAQGRDWKTPKSGSDEFLARTGCEPNIFIDGPPAHDEESWKKVTFQPEPGSKCHESTYHIRHGLPEDQENEMERGRSEGVHCTPAPTGSDAPDDMFTFIEVGMSVDIQDTEDQAIV